MKRWRRRRTSSLRRSNSGRYATCGAIALAIICTIGVSAYPFVLRAGSGRPLRPVTGGPPLLVIVPPQMTWGQLRAADLRGTAVHPGFANVGLLPVASPSGPYPNRTWVTLGAGTAAVGVEVRGEALPGGGFKVDVGPIRAANQRAHTSALPGLLGSQLHGRGMTTALIAYQASQQPQVPPSAAVVMDEHGRIDGGGLYRPAELSPLGKRLDPDQVASAVGEALARHDLVLLDLTGLASLANATAVIGRAAEAARARAARFCLLSALAPASRELDRHPMGFLVTEQLWRSGGVALLESASTRWPGVIVAADFAPTLLMDFGLPGAGAGMNGRPIQIVEEHDPLARLDRLDRMLTDQFILEGKAARLYVSYMMLLAAATFLFGARWRWLAYPALVGVMLPIGLLLCPLAGIGQGRQLALGLAASVLLAWAALRLGKCVQAKACATPMPLRIAAGAGGVVILADVLLGSPLMRLAPLGFGAVTGARFYGIGNEYAGVLGAMAPIYLGLGLAGRPGAGWLAALAGATVVLVVGAPWWGANWGGCVSVAAGLISVWVALAPRSRWRRVIAGIAGALIAAALPAALDLVRPEMSRSHIGVAAATLLSGHLGGIREIAARKLEMNWRLAQLASWWWLLAPVGLLGIWELVRRSREMWRGAAVSPATRAGFLGALVAAGAGLLLNDSGVVMCGMALAVTFAAFVFLVARREAVKA